MTTMKSIKEIRRANFARAIEEKCSGNQTEAATRLEYSTPSLVSRYATGKKDIGDRAARKMEEAFGLPNNWMDADHTPVRDDDAKAPSDARPWPFPSIAEAAVRALPAGQLSALEGAMALAIAQLNLGIKVAAPPRPPEANAPRVLRGGLYADDGTDEFPMRIAGLPVAPWDGGTTTQQTERAVQSLRISHAANVGHVPRAGYSANDQEFLSVPELDVRLAAGKLGIENYEETAIGEILLRRSFLESFKLPIERMKIVYADGDSMEPVIRNEGPMLFYEEAVTDVRLIDPRTVYAINHGGKMIVKCISRERDGTWLAKSLNPAYPPFPLEKEDGRDVRIVGRILWSPYDLRNGVDQRLL
ncbi:S24 family peptidase [Achromobacter spanius]|uniref:S24 family peptidase n=1 Tax=Achromobacter spanius TaxID=217203 RepID=UPI001F0C0AC3|nr:S24 family peptidase [Achromobacter spanius]